MPKYRSQDSGLNFSPVMMIILGLGVVAYMIFKMRTCNQKIKAATEVEMREIEEEKNRELGSIDTTNRFCKDLRNGEFDYYGKATQKQYLIIRKDSIQKEVPINTTDTTYFLVSWLDDCVFTSKYLRGGDNSSEDFKNYMLSHLTFVEILQTTPDYYIFKATIDSLNNTNRRVIDTVCRRK